MKLPRSYTTGKFNVTYALNGSTYNLNIYVVATLQSMSGTLHFFKKVITIFCTTLEQWNIIRFSCNIKSYLISIPKTKASLYHKWIPLVQ